MAQWTVIRQAIATNRDVAELMTAGLHGEKTLDAADQLRLKHMLNENLWGHTRHAAWRRVVEHRQEVGVSAAVCRGRGRGIGKKN